MKQSTSLVFRRGFRDGIPIGLGYLAVSFSLGIAARNVGLTALQGALASLFTIASAGEYAAFRLIGDHASYLEMALVILVTNGRYLLMSCAMTQRLDPAMNPIHRVGMGAFITDEIFGAGISQQGYMKPAYTYGLASASVPLWTIGTALGIIVGNLLPAFLVRALGVALYGMFLAIIIPPAKEKHLLLGLVLISFAISFASGHLPLLSTLSEGTRIILLTLVIAGAAALLCPVPEEADKTEEESHA